MDSQNAPTPIRRILLTLLFAFLAAAVAGAALFLFDRRTVGTIAARMAMGSKPINVLVIANNARGVRADDPLGLGTAAGQADVILVARFDPLSDRIYAITVPRDTLFAQPGWNNPIPKIKTLFFMGDQETPRRGPELLEKAVSALTGLPLDGYVAINFAGFEHAVNLVGGLTVDVKKRIYDPRHSGAVFAPGITRMNGAQVLAFVRVRQNDAGNDYRINDFQRMQAEVEVAGLLRDKLLDPHTVATLLPTFIAKIKPDIATDLPEPELLHIGIAMAGAPVYQISLGSMRDSMLLASTALPGVNAQGWMEGDYYDVLDPARVRQALAGFGSTSNSTGLPSPPPSASLPLALYGSTHLALHLEHQGFKRTVRLAESPGYGRIRVVYPAGNPAAGWAVARAIGRGDEYVLPGDVKRVTVYE